MTLSCVTRSGRESRTWPQSSLPLPSPAQIDALRQRLALGSCEAGVKLLGHQLGWCPDTRGSCSSCKTRPGTPLSDTLSLANSTKTTSQGYGQGATSPRCLLVKLQAQLLPFPTSLFRLKSFCYPIKKVIKMITTSIRCSQQMSQLVLHSSWLPAARCHGWTGAACSILGPGWTSIWESWGAHGARTGKDFSSHLGSVTLSALSLLAGSCMGAVEEGELMDSPCSTTKPIILVAIKREERQSPPTKSICKS